jgi:hypothetical protein
MYLIGASPILTSNIVAKNETGLYAENSEGNISHPTFRSNDFSNNGAYNAFGVIYPAGSDRNISADPLFAADAYREYHLSQHSPCLNGGDTSYVLEMETDIDGNWRVIDPNVDIGAYEVTAYTATDAATALRIAAGIYSADYTDTARLDISPDSRDYRITLEDAVRVACKVTGLEANP